MIAVSEEEWVPYHKRVLRALIVLSRSISGVHRHSSGLEYTSLMSCFLMHNVSAAQSLLTLCENAGADWFPVSVGYMIARTIFEVDVTAHFITLEPQERASQYILFEHILNKRAMDVCNKHRKSDDPSWREATEREWHEKWERREKTINEKFVGVEGRFTKEKNNGKKAILNSWSGKNIRELSVAVGHGEAYDIFYSSLSSFVHMDALSANQFLRLPPDGPIWTQRADQFHVGEVLHDAASFFACYLKLFGSQFDVWEDATVNACWLID